MSNEFGKPGFLSRIRRALWPIAGGLLLDFGDLATFGPIGIVAGFFVGAAVALWISSISRFSLQTRVILALLAGLYCMVPMTELLPLATLAAVLCRFFEPLPPPAENADRPPRKHVESKTVEKQDIKD